LAGGRPVSANRLEVGGETSGFVHEPEDTPGATASSGRGRNWPWPDFLGGKFADIGAFQADASDETAFGLALAIWFGLNGLAIKPAEIMCNTIFVPLEKRFTR
jgi:hypothetical protein